MYIALGIVVDRALEIESSTGIRPFIERFVTKGFQAVKQRPYLRT